MTFIECSLKGQDIRLFNRKGADTSLFKQKNELVSMFTW